jgi:signal peptidase I
MQHEAAQCRGTGATGRQRGGDVSERMKTGKKKSEFFEEAQSFLLEILFVGIGLLLVYCFLFGGYRAGDNAMYPAVRDGDLVLFYRLDKTYAVRDLVVLDTNGEKQVRRVEAVAGDTVDFQDGKLVLDGIPQDETGIYEDSEQFTEGTDFPLTVPEGEVFVLGDARENATDSRIYGCVKVEETYGSVVLVVRRREF